MPSEARVCLNPEADLWSLPGTVVLGQFATGLHAFPGAIAQATAEILRTGPRSPEQLFAALLTQDRPDQIVSHLGELRSAGLLSGTDAQDWLPEMSAADLSAAGLPVWLGGSADGSDHHPWLVFGALSDLQGLQVPAHDWMPLDASAQRITVGPLFPAFGPRPCLECLILRADQHDDLTRLLRSRPDARKLQSRRTRPDIRASELAFIRRARLALGDAPTGTILVRNAHDASEITARAIPVGGCTVCSAAALRFDIAPHHKAVLRSGGYRPLSSKDLLARIDPLVDPVTGIIRRLSNLPSPPSAKPWSHVLIAHHAFPLSAPDLTSTFRNRRGRSAGKGRHAEHARAGAMAEAYERYAGVALPDDPRHIARETDLSGPVITPQEWLLFGDDQYADAQSWRATNEAAAFVPDRLQPDDLLEWVRVSSLGTGQTAWAPAALCWHQFSADPRCGLPGVADSNGCAAGQTMLDAQLQGLLELVERDAVGIWWWNRSRRPEIVTQCLQDPWVEGVSAMLSDLGYDLALQDLTHDLGVPVIAAIGWPRGDAGPMLLGFGAHPSVATAVSRAVTEILQALPERRPSEAGGLPWKGLGHLPGTAGPTLKDFDFLRPGGGTSTDQPAPGAELASPTADAALKRLLGTLNSRGLNVWMLDQSRPDVPLPVVRMIVPGLRHFRPRFGAGRLQDVPRKMAWPVTAARFPCFIRQ